MFIYTAVGALIIIVIFIVSFLVSDMLKISYRKAMIYVVRFLFVAYIVGLLLKILGLEL